MKEERIIQFISGQLSPEEKDSFLAWISESPENKEEYYKLRNLWALTSQSDSGGTIPEEEIITFQKNIRANKVRALKTRVFIITRYAAVIALAFFAGKFVFQTKSIPEAEALYNEISVPPGQMARVTLSDGTEIFINSCSKLKYPAVFSSGNRKVYLSGEAYFDVKKGKTPFLVESGRQVVKVLGTEFNILAYPEDNLYQTTLVKGRISMLDTLGNQVAILKPGEQYSFDMLRNKRFVKVVNPDLFDSWKEGLYTFDHETLGSIAERLERTYAIRITISNNKIKNYKFSGTISRNVPFEQILKIIQISAPVQYKLKELHGAIDEVILY